MKFLKKLFGKKKIVVTETVSTASLNLNEISESLKEKKASATKDVFAESSQISKEFPSIRDNILQRVDVLEKAEPETETMKRPAELINNARRHYVNGVRNLLQGIPFGKNSNYEELEALNHSVMNALANLRKLSGKHTRMISFLYHEKLGEVRNELNVLITTSEKLNKNIRTSSEQVKKISDKLQKVEQLRKKVDEKEKLENEKGDLKTKFETLPNEIKNVEEELKALEQSEDAKKAEETRKYLESRELRCSEIKTNIMHGLSPIERLLRKFRKITYDLDASSRALIDCIDTCLNEPSKILSENWTGNLGNMLEQLKSAIETDKLDIKDKEKEKSLSKVRNLISNDLDGKREEYLKTRVKIKTLQEELKSSQFLQHKKELEKKIENMNNEAETAEGRVEKISEEIPSIDERISSLKTELETGLKGWEGDEVSIKI